MEATDGIRPGSPNPRDMTPHRQQQRPNHTNWLIGFQIGSDGRQPVQLDIPNTEVPGFGSWRSSEPERCSFDRLMRLLRASVGPFVTRFQSLQGGRSNS